MRVQRLDLGVDIVVVPDQALIILHPDLSFGQAVGAISAALPDMHSDVVYNLVSQVTQRPRRAPVGSLLVAAPVLGLILVGVLGLTSAPEPYGNRWKDAVTALELECDPAERGRTCVGPNGTSYEVTAYTRNDGALYVLRSGEGRKYLRTFESRVTTDWLQRNPAADALDTYAVTWH